MLAEVLSAEHVDHFLFANLLGSFGYFFGTNFLGAPADKIASRPRVQETNSLQMQRLECMVIQIINAQSLHIHSFRSLSYCLFPMGLSEEHGLGLIAV